MVIKRLGPLSCAKIAGTLYAILGLFVGGLIALVSLVGGFASAASRGGVPGFGMFFGVGAVLLVPILYGCLGFVMALIGAALYNITAGLVGGIEIDLDKSVL